MVNKIIKIPAKKGPTKGIKFKSEHKKAITSALGVPIINNTRV